MRKAYSAKVDNTMPSHISVVKLGLQLPTSAPEA